MASSPRTAVARRSSAAILLVSIVAGGCQPTQNGAVTSLEEAADVALGHMVASGSASPGRSQVVFAVPQPLPTGTMVQVGQSLGPGAGDPAAEPIPPRLLREIDTETWLLWPGERRANGLTRLVFIDRATGRVTTDDADSWPLVDGEEPWVVAAYYASPQARTFVNIDPTPMAPETAARRATIAQHPALSDRPALFSFAAEPDGRTVAALINGWKDGEPVEEQLAGNVDQARTALERWSVDTIVLGTTPYDRRDAMRGWFAATAPLLGAGDTLLVYLTGHGNDVNGGNVGGLFAYTLQRWLSQFDPSVRIVVIVDSCCSRSWEGSMTRVADQVMTSTHVSTCAWSDLDKTCQGTELTTLDPNQTDVGTENTSSWVTALHAIAEDPVRRSAVEIRAADTEESLVEALLVQAFADAVLLDAAAINGMTMPRSVAGD